MTSLEELEKLIEASLGVSPRSDTAFYYEGYLLVIDRTASAASIVDVWGVGNVSYIPVLYRDELRYVTGDMLRQRIHEAIERLNAYAVTKIV